MSFVPQMVQLPSKGFFYPEQHGLSQGSVKMRYPTAADQDILTSRSLINQGIVLDEFLKAILEGRT